MFFFLWTPVLETFNLLSIIFGCVNGHSKPFFFLFSTSLEVQVRFYNRLWQNHHVKADRGKNYRVHEWHNHTYLNMKYACTPPQFIVALCVNQATVHTPSSTFISSLIRIFFKPQSHFQQPSSSFLQVNSTPNEDYQMKTVVSTPNVHKWQRQGKLKRPILKFHHTPLDHNVGDSPHDYSPLVYQTPFYVQAPINQHKGFTNWTTLLLDHSQEN